MMKNKKVALITGGTSGIGFETSMKFLKEGYVVAACSIDNDEKVKHAMEKMKCVGMADYYYLDVADEKNCEKVTDRVYEKYGRLDVLINSAGVVGTLNPITGMDLNDVRRTIGINLLGTVYMSFYASKKMMGQGGGVIINIGSISGKMATNCGVGYHSSKAGVHMASLVMAKDLSRYGIRVLALAPGSVNTGLQNPALAEKAAAFMLKNRMIEPYEIANAAYLLAMDEASAINGTVVMVDDGFCAWKSL